MKYLILKKSNCPLFFVDRNKTKKFWWSYLLCYAMYFTSREVAQAKADSLEYGVLRVITENEARSIRNHADFEHEKEMDKLADKRDYMNNYDPGDSEYWDHKDF